MRIVITYQQRLDTSYIELIELAFKSAKHHGYETVMVGNIRCGADHYIELDRECEPRLMNWVLAAQLKFIESHLFTQESVLFSPDALIIKPLEDVFQENFHLAFTHRDNPKWPINNGVIYLKPAWKEEIALFWRDAIAVCKSYSLETQEWYGDQQSLWDVYKAERFYGLNIKLFPCTKYNASPARTSFGIDKTLMKEAYIVHFKGRRKNQMQKYWSFYDSQSKIN